MTQQFVVTQRYTFLQETEKLDQSCVVMKNCHFMNDVCVCVYVFLHVYNFNYLYIYLGLGKCNEFSSDLCSYSVLL